tara:strand:- start:317 stop:655 length:339 start_codon:yes stop_codon:yes gene_type:complete
MTPKQMNAIRDAHANLLSSLDRDNYREQRATIGQLEEQFPALLDNGLDTQPREFDYYVINLNQDTLQKFGNVTMAWLWDNDTEMADAFETEIQALDVGEEVYHDYTIIRRVK